MKYTAAVITISDSASKDPKIDTSGPALCKLLSESGFDVVHKGIVPDERKEIQDEIIASSDKLNVNLILTTGGTGFSPRDITPEATREIIEREAPGISEYMRQKSMEITDRGCLSRGISGIRKSSLIINLPGSRKASTENMSAVINPVKHGIEMMVGSGSANCAPGRGEVVAVCISERKGTVKHEVDEITLIDDYGVENDAHAKTPNRQVSLLGVESVEKLEQKVNYKFAHGAFAENILTKGIELFTIPVGTKFVIGNTKCELTQIGKKCHNDCEIKRQTGDCVMPREGVFVKVLEGGTIKKGDIIEVCNE